MPDPLHNLIDSHLIQLRGARSDAIDQIVSSAKGVLGLDPATVRAEAERLIPRVPDAPWAAAAPSPQRLVPLGEAILGNAVAHRGKRYTWGGNGIDAFDCSALTQRAHRDVCIAIGRTTYDQISQGREIPWGEQQIGDLIFSRFSAPNRPEHVSIWAGNGKVFEAGDPLDFYAWGDRGVVRVRRMW